MLGSSLCRRAIAVVLSGRACVKALISLAALGATGAAMASVILDVSGNSLTTYLPTAATGVQGVWPVHQQRGVNIDGSARARGGLPWSFAANPLNTGGGESWNANQKLGDLRLDLGSYAPTEVDLALPATGFRWVVGRSYNGVQSNGSHLDSDGYQGRNWAQLGQPEIALYVNSGDHTKDTLYIVYGADRYLEFQRTGSSSTEYKGKNGVAGVVQYASGTPDLWTYTDQVGNVTTFFGGNTASNQANWQLWKMADPAGNTAYIGHASTAATAVSSGFDASGRVLYAYDTSDRRYTYAYSTIDSVVRLTQVKAETHSGGTWASSPTGVVTVGTVDYAYYQTGDDTYGDHGTLKLVTVTTPLSPTSTNLVQNTYYRYWKGTYNSSTNPGHPSTIQLVVGPEGYRKYDWDQDGNLDDDAQAASLSNLKAYSDAYLEYDSSFRVNKGFFNGECGCSGGNNGEYTFSYGTNGSFSDTPTAYDTAWKSRTVLHRPDAVYETQYFDETGQPIGRAITNTDPSSSPSKTWATDVIRDSAGLITEIRTPANITTYTHSTGSFTASTTDGLIQIFTRGGSGDYAGFLTDTKHRNSGTSTGNANYDQVFEYVDGSPAPPSVTVGGVTVTRPVVETSETQATETNVISSPDATATVVTAHSGAGSGMIKQRTTTAPTVTSANNGSNSGTSRDVYSRPDGTVAFTRTATGVYTYTQYTDGLLVKKIDDCITNSGGDFAGGDDPNTNFGITETGDGLSYVTTYTHDAQGRPDTTTLPDGRVTKMYYTKLSDGRMVTLSIPRVVAGSPTYYGPASYTVSNLTGKPEFQGTIAITSSGITTALSSWVSTGSADPISALGVGTLARMSTSVLNKAGTRVEESRSYFSIPGSGAGSAGTNYDAVKYGFDDMGRRWRVKDATATITRTVFDELGRATESWIGTNDNSFTGGEASGPDTMTKTSVTVYDSGSAGGNSYVTKRTLDPDGDWTGGNTDKRETSYTNNARGWPILVSSPLSPYTVNKYDNLGRVTAVGQYSSLSGFTITTNPTSEATARLGLSESFYDERGQVWKTIRHKIDVSDGSDDDTLVSTTWYDPNGAVIKSRSPSGLTKTRYDRLGRATHRFTLAKDNDAANTYSDVWTSGATTVAGDIVLEEHQTTYDNADKSGLAVMQATISRFHDDLSNGTADPLDSNADGNSYKYTAANLAGRLSVTATWYDAWERPTDTASYGTNGSGNATDFDRRPSGVWLSVPSRSDTVLVTSYSYNDDGTVQDVTDPRGKVARTLYDNLGRKTATIANYVNGTPSGDTGDDDNYTRHVYSNGLQTKMWVDLDGDNVEDGTDQVTLYTFGTVKGASAGDSRIATGHLLQKVTYPDSASGSDVVAYAYNALGQQIWTKDQAANVIETDYDVLGRATQKRVTTIDNTSFDDAVLRIGTTFDSRGMVQLVTQYTSSTVGAGSVVDEVKYTYDDWGNVTAFEQDRNGTVGGGGDQYTVGYSWAKATPSGGHDTLRCTGMTLPGSGDSSSITYTYDSGSYALGDVASRVTALKTGGSPTTRATYQYLGASMLVGTDLLEPSEYSRLYSASQTYDAIDRFNRVGVSRWTKDLGTPRNFYQVTLTYDRDSNITVAQDAVHPGYDVAYTMDGRNRLTQAKEGTWGGSSIGSTTRDEQWTLSQPGNWAHHKYDMDGDGNFNAGLPELDDAGTFNTVNELTARDIDNDSANDFTLTYDAVGNLTNDGEYKYVPDAFGRLRKVKNQSNALVAEYTYNGLGYRIGWHYDTTQSGGGAPDGTVDSYDPRYSFAYDTRWRMVATFRGSDTAPKERFVWHNAGLNGRGGSSYIDTCVLRDRDANTAWTASADGALEERVYYAQNWRGDVSVVMSAAGNVQEWVKYSPYGTPMCIPPVDFNGDGFVNSADSDDYADAYILGTWDARVDLNLSGTLTSGDQDLFDDLFYLSEPGGYGVLSAASVGNRLGYAGYQHAPELAGAKWHVRHRVLDSSSGRWNRRDPLGYVDDANLYQYCLLNPVHYQDSDGRCVKPCASCVLSVIGTNGAALGVIAACLLGSLTGPAEWALCGAAIIAMIVAEGSANIQCMECLACIDKTKRQPEKPGNPKSEPDPGIVDPRDKSNQPPAPVGPPIAVLPCWGQTDDGCDPPDPNSVDPCGCDRRKTNNEEKCNGCEFFSPERDQCMRITGYLHDRCKKLCEARIALN